MTLDATFWVTISFFIFLGILIYFKIPHFGSQKTIKYIVPITPQKYQNVLTTILAKMHMKSLILFAHMILMFIVHYVNILNHPSESLLNLCIHK